MSHFNQVADRYDAYAHVQQSILKWAQPFIHSASECHILEMGAGTGLFTEHLLSLQAQSILATDASPRMLAQCQKIWRRFTSALSGNECLAARDGWL